MFVGTANSPTRLDGLLQEDALTHKIYLFGRNRLPKHFKALAMKESDIVRSSTRCIY